MFRGDEDTVTLTLVDVAIVVAAALRALDPELAASIEATSASSCCSSDLGGVTGDVLRLARRLRVLALVLAGLTLAAAAAALALSRDRRRTAAQLGAGVAVAGVAIVAADTIARGARARRASTSRTCGRPAWDAFLGDLRTAGWLIAGAGAVVAAAAASLVRPVAVEEPLRARLART